MDYLLEYEDGYGKLETKVYDDLVKARRRARYLSANDRNLLVYVVACTNAERVGAEAYAYGRRDHVEGRMA